MDFNDVVNRIMEIGYSYCVKSKLAYATKMEENYIRMREQGEFDGEEFKQKYFDIKKVKKDDSNWAFPNMEKWSINITI